MAGQPVRRIRRMIGDMKAKLAKLPKGSEEAKAVEADIARHEDVLRRHKAGEEEAVFEIIAPLAPLPPNCVVRENPVHKPPEEPEWSPVFGMPFGDPDPLTETEFAVVRAVMAVTKGDCPEGDLLSRSGAEPDEWLEEAFPALGPRERVRAARFLAVAAGMAGRPPSDFYRDTVFEEAAKAAGLSVMAFEVMRKRDSAFDAAQTAVAAARKRSVMWLLEEKLLERAYNGQIEDTPLRNGEVVSVRKFDNNLAFNLLKTGHEKYRTAGRKAKEDGEGDGGGGMSLVIARAGHPSSGMRRAKRAEEAGSGE